MATINKRGMASNPYRHQSSPITNPVVMVGATVTIIIFVILQILSSGSSNEGGSVGGPMSGLRPLANDKGKSPESPGASEVRGQQKQVEPQDEMKLQQDIRHDEKKMKHGGEGIHVDAFEKFEFDDTLYFHHYRRGKSAAVIEDMLMAHAYAFHMGGTYGGCCIEPGIKIERHEELLDALGLKEVLPFKCPGDYHEQGMRKTTVPKEKYHSDDTRIWTPAYVSFLKSLVSYPPRNDDEFVIVAHVRRGEITPCKKQNRGYDRYLPNQHFLNVIDLYNKPGAQVEIITESNSFEPVDAFRQKGYQVNLEDDLASIWRTFISADIVILSRSDFSMIPAVLSMGQVVYTPFWHPPIRGWDRVPKEIMDQTDAELRRLKDERCQVKRV